MLAKLMVKPGSAAGLSKRKTDDHAGLAGKAEGKKQLEKLVDELSILHNRLYAESERSLLLVLQGLDASGKDGTIKSVLTGVNPQGCRIVSFKQPSAAELAHDYLWRIHLACPERGEIGILNRSHYEDVVAARVRKLVPKAVWSRRPHHIREFERLLVDDGDQNLLFTVGKDGILWKLDRKTGKYLGHKETVFQNVWERFDPQTGRPTYRSDILEQRFGEWLQGCPSTEGGHNWPASTYYQHRQTCRIRCEDAERALVL